MNLILTELEYTAPTAPDGALELIPQDRATFGSDLWKVVTAAIEAVEPEIGEAARLCVAVFAVVMLISLVKAIHAKGGGAAQLAGVLAVAGLLLHGTGSMVTLAAETVTELSEYGKLLLPVMTAALAAQGGMTASAGLYAGTAVFDAVLSAAVAKLLLPIVYLFLAVSTAASATGEKMLEALRDFLKWLVTWCLKTVLYIFTGYMGITGVVSGTADAAALKATKLTVSGMVPVVGGILSDASEAVLVGAGVMQSAVGVYGMLALIAIWIRPFLRIGVLYLLLKLTAALCEIFDVPQLTGLVKAFSGAMGLLLAMTGTVCVMLLISAVCFLKGVG